MTKLMRDCFMRDDIPLRLRYHLSAIHHLTLEAMELPQGKSSCF